MSVERGEALGPCLRRLLFDFEPEFRQDILHLLLHFERYGTSVGIKFQCRSSYRREILHLVAQGVAGEPIHARLLELEEEIKRACDDEIERFVALLPVRALLPLLLIQFPAFLLLLFGPIIEEFTRSFSQ